MHSKTEPSVNMEALILAAATDDGEQFMDRHFGDAGYYNLYRLTPEKLEFIKKISNVSEKERMHADPVKAQGVTEMLKKENVQVAVSKVFGPNIKRIQKKFVCVLTQQGSIEEKLNVLRKQFSRLTQEWQAGETRAIIKL